MSATAMQPFAGAVLVRWALCAAIVLGAHVAAAVALTRAAQPAEATETAGIFAVDIAQEAVAQSDARAAAPPGPPVTPTAASVATPPPTKPDRPPENQPEPATETPPLPHLPRLPKLADGDAAAPAKPEAVPERTSPPPAIAAPPVEARSAPEIVAARTGPTARATSIGAPDEALRKAFAGWQSLMLDRIERQKRYPAKALASRHQGTAIVQFSVDPQGRLLDAAIQQTSGSEPLDVEALALLRRAAPFPAVPGGVAASDLSFAVPITFKLR